MSISLQCYQQCTSQKHTSLLLNVMQPIKIFTIAHKKKVHDTNLSKIRYKDVYNTTKCNTQRNRNNKTLLHRKYQVLQVFFPPLIFKMFHEYVNMSILKKKMQKIHSIDYFSWKIPELPKSLLMQFNQLLFLMTVILNSSASEV